MTPPPPTRLSHLQSGARIRLQLAGGLTYTGVFLGVDRDVHGDLRTVSVETPGGWVVVVNFAHLVSLSVSPLPPEEADS